MARIGTEITLKCFRRPTEDRVELRPCSKNPQHCAIAIDEQTEDWKIQKTHEFWPNGQDSCGCTGGPSATGGRVCDNRTAR